MNKQEKEPRGKKQEIHLDVETHRSHAQESHKIHKTGSYNIYSKDL